MKDTSVIHRIKDRLLLYGKSIIWVRRSEPNPAKEISAKLESTEVRNNTINIHSVGTARHEPETLCQTHGSFSSHSRLHYSRSLKQVSKDGRHLVEAVGSAPWLHRHGLFGRPSFEKLQTSDFRLPGWIFLSFSPAIWVLLYLHTSIKQF